MKLHVTSILVDDQAVARDFYTRVLGFELRHDLPMGAHRWLTVAERGNAGATEVLLEPAAYEPARTYRAALKRDGMPVALLQVPDVDAEHERLRGLGVAFTREPMDAGPVRIAVLDDTCGNLLQLVQMKGLA